MKSITFVAFLSLLFFTACNVGENASNERNLPNSSGRIDEIVVVMDDEHWEDTTETGVGEAVRRLLLADYKGLPQSEPIFSISHVDPLNFHPLIQRASNIIYFGVLDGDGPTSRVLNRQMETLPENVNPQNMYSAKDVWAKPQQVTYFFTKKESDFATVVEQKKDKIIERLYKIENEKALRNSYASRVNSELTEKLKTDFNLEFKVPNSYRFVKQTENSFWIRQDVQGEVSNVMIHSIPYNDDSEFGLDHAIKTRDEMGEMFSTDTPESHMITDMRLDPLVVNLQIDDAQAMETRGSWRMSKDYLGGPFINYCIKDTKNKRLLVLDGSVFAPQWPKRRPIRKLENMLKTITLL